MVECAVRSIVPTDPKVLFLAVSVVGLIYLLQLASPLRTQNDSIAYLSMAESAARGEGFLVDGEETRYPPGYAAILVACMRTGAARSSVFIAINIALLAVGLTALHFVLRKGMGLTTREATMVVLLCLLSRGFIKYTLPVMSDIAYFAVSTGCLLAFIGAENARSPRRWGLLAAGVGLLVCATIVRTAGVTLIAPLLFTVFRGTPRRVALDTLGRLNWTAAASVAGGVLVVAFVLVQEREWLISLHPYLSLAESRFAELGGAEAMEFIGGRRIAEQGIIWLNLPEEIYPTEYRTILPLLTVVGLLAMAAGTVGFWVRRHRFGVVEAYVLAYVGLHIVYPFFLDRHWLPLIPFALVYYRDAVATVLPGAARVIAASYAGWFVVAGVVTLAVNTRISYSGSDFPSLYRYNPETYRAAFDGSVSPAHPDLDPDLLELLRRYEPLAVGATTSR